MKTIQMFLGSPSISISTGAVRRRTVQSETTTAGHLPMRCSSFSLASTSST